MDNVCNCNNGDQNKESISNELRTLRESVKAPLMTLAPMVLK